MAAICPETDQHSVISFDVFDTLLRRPFAEPDDALRYLERRNDVPGWFAARKEAEILAVRESQLECASLEQIYSRLPENWRFMAAREVDFDLEILRPNRDVLALFNDFKESGKTIIITTDTYYSKEDIARFLQKNCYTGYSRIFASCEYGHTKSRGTLFSDILQELNIHRPQEILHIGDSRHSDLRMPERLGIHVHHLPSTMEAFRKAKESAPILKYWCSRHGISAEEQILRSYQVGILAAMCREGGFPDQDPFLRMFLCAFPFLLLQFDSFLFASAKEGDYRNLAFIARDGYLLKDIFDRRHNADGSFNTPYVYASRLLLKNFMSSGPAARECYQKYLHSLGLLGRDVLCVDWGGINFTAQRHLSSYFRNTGGTYCNAREPADLKIGNFIPVLLRFHELVEIYITSPEKPVRAVAESENGYVPVYKEDSVSFPEIEQIRTLMRNFLTNFDFPSITFSGETARHVMDIYFFILPRLSRQDLRQLKKFRNCSSIAHENEDFKDVWADLRKSCRPSQRLLHILNSSFSRAYRKIFHLPSRPIS